ncbi:hypothetical protein MPLDJ20_50164 [Mesorhizobium plurifarium]|uniref:Uncharacterized protein n=1 Tax=Mesorhizobium plurifarium TaxID=69974 RepID=A0A090FM30_MESPL|nr:hypothetical protein MPLDJ20_50164 [Mesorhizobium plurifarium]CDX58035.1 hypothetical protein MPL1032_230161 [Mesorhizobium plurifarium]
MMDYLCGLRYLSAEWQGHWTRAADSRPIISANQNLGWIGEEHAIGLVLRRLQHAWAGTRRHAA